VKNESEDGAKLSVKLPETKARMTKVSFQRQQQKAAVGGRLQYKNFSLT
jgi:hypothetical protein